MYERARKRTRGNMPPGYLPNAGMGRGPSPAPFPLMPPNGGSFHGNYATVAPPPTMGRGHAGPGQSWGVPPPRGRPQHFRGNSRWGSNRPNPAPAHGRGRGRAAVLPAWMAKQQRGN